MLVGLRIISILFDLFLAVVLFYTPLSKKGASRRLLIFLTSIILFHIVLVFLFSESSLFLVSNIILSIIEYYVLAFYFNYSFRDSSFWIFSHVSLTLLAGAILNQGIQLFLPLSEVAGNLLSMISYLMVNFFLSTLVTLVLRQLFLEHQRLTFGVSKENWFYQFIVPLLSIFFAFIISAIHGQVFEQSYLPFVSLLSLIVLTFSSLYFSLSFSKQYQHYYQKNLEKEQLQFQLREVQQSQKDYQRLERFRHDLKNRHLTLLSLLEDDPQQARDYLHTLTEKIEEKQVFYSKNPTINFLLNQKLHYLADELSLEVNCFVPRQLAIPPEVLAVILGNCLDNSIAACLRLPDIKERVLSLELRYFQQFLYIGISNTFDENELTNRDSRQKEGWGLRNIDALVQEYQGSVKRFIESGEYRTEILLQL